MALGRRLGAGPINHSGKRHGENRCFTCDLDVADVAEQLAEAEPRIDAREMDGLVDLDVRAHERHPALDALGDQPPASIVQILEIAREPALGLHSDPHGL